MAVALIVLAQGTARHVTSCYDTCDWSDPHRSVQYDGCVLVLMVMVMVRYEVSYYSLTGMTPIDGYDLGRR